MFFLCIWFIINSEHKTTIRKDHIWELQQRNLQENWIFLPPLSPWHWTTNQESALQHGSSSWMPQKNMDMIFLGSRKNIPLPGRFILLSIKNMEQLLQIPRFSLRFPREFHRDAKRMTIVWRSAIFMKMRIRSRNRLKKFSILTVQELFCLEQKWKAEIWNRF